MDQNLCMLMIKQGITTLEASGLALDSALPTSFWSHSNGAVKRASDTPSEKPCGTRSLGLNLLEIILD